MELNFKTYKSSIAVTWTEGRVPNLEQIMKHKPYQPQTVTCHLIDLLTASPQSPKLLFTYCSCAVQEITMENSENFSQFNFSDHPNLASIKDICAWIKTLVLYSYWVYFYQIIPLVNI